MSLAKKEFLSLKDKIESEDIKVTVVTKFKDRSVVGYAIFDSFKYEIKVQKDKSMSYTEVLMNLLHEYGHILDRKRYGNTKRWKDTDQWEYDNVENTLDIPLGPKKNILKTEFMAKEISKKLRKKFNIQSLNDETIEGNELLNILIRRYEVLYGKPTTRALKNFWKDGIIEGKIKLTLKDILNFKKDLKCLSMTLNV